MTSCRMAVTGRKGERVRPPISLARHDDSSEAGFTLLEVICVVAIIAILAAVALPFIPRGTSGPRLRAYATSTAAIFKADRNAAIRRQLLVVTHVEDAGRLIRSGTTDRIIRLPDDVATNVLLPARCNSVPAKAAVVFFPSGMSCGGVITFTRAGVGFEVRVNWLTGGAEIVPVSPT
jgi:general secretion pathway protein H